MDPNESLSEHFTLDELIASDIGARRGIDNTPGQSVITNLMRLARRLEMVRAELDNPLHINSGYRCPALNEAVGGSRNSRHMLGLAADFVCRGYGTPLEVCRALEPHLARIEIDQLIYEHTWVHLGLAPAGEAPRRQVLTLMPGGTYAQGIVERGAT